MFKFRKLKSILSEEYENTIDVTCSRCGQVTSISYSNKLPELDKILCKHCEADLKNEFFSLLLRKEINSLKVLQSYVLKVFVFALGLGLLISIYLFFGRKNLMGYILLTIPVIVMAVTTFKYFQIRTKVKELCAISDKFCI